MVEVGWGWTISIQLPIQIVTRNLYNCLYMSTGWFKTTHTIFVHYINFQTFKNVILLFKAYEMSLLFEESLIYTLITFQLTQPEWNDIENGRSLFVKGVTDHCGQSGNKNVYVWSGERSPASRSSPGLLPSISCRELSSSTLFVNLTNKTDWL